MPEPVGQKWLGWRQATEEALYGSGGFFTRGAGPAAHFRTSVHASGLFADAVLDLVRQMDETLGRPAELVVTDVGAGRGELLTALAARADAELPELAERLVLRGVEKAERPSDLPERVAWGERIDPIPAGLLFANEWLDNVPLDIAEVHEHDVARLVLVDPDSGEERLGDPVSGPEAAWLRRWWPLDHAEPGMRAEIGLPRDQAWADAVGSLGRGVAVAVDYAHTADRRPLFGTLAAYREGHEVPPVPNGRSDLTSHVALDACLDTAAHRHPVVHSLWTTQRAALRLSGIRGTRPPLELAATDPAAYLRALAAAGEAAELTTVGGLGSFVWGLQSVGVGLPGPWLALQASGDGTLLPHDE